MSKDPRFNFYPDNYEGGTDFFTLEMDGAYLRLFILQFRYGQFTERQAIQKLMTRCPENPGRATELWNSLKDKYQTDGANYWNQRLRDEIEKSKKASEDQRDRVNKRWGKQSGTNPVDTGAIPEPIPTQVDTFSSNSSSTSSNNSTSSTNNKKNTAVADVYAPDRVTVINELNTLTGRNFDPNADYFKKNLNARIKEYGVPDLIDMVRFMVYKRKGSEWEAYLKPDTMFRPDKCASYIEDMKHHRANGIRPKKDVAPTNGVKTQEQLMEEIRIHRLKKQQFGAI